MADTTTKQILIDVQLKSDELKNDVVTLNSTLDQLLIKQLQLKGAGQQNTAQFVGLASEIRNTKTAIREANKEIDNTNKALNAQTGSINQNKALVSLLTSEYNKLSSSQGKSAASTVAMGNRLKEVTEILNKQRQAVGNNTSNIGNYTQSILAAIPGLGSFSSAISTATNAFNLLGTASKTATTATEEGEAATTGLTSSMAGLIAGAAAAIGVLVAVATALANLTPNAEKAQRAFSGIGNVWRQMIANFSDEKLDDNFETFKQKWSTFFASLKNAYTDAAALKGEFQDLARSAAILEVANAEADSKIADLQLKMRNRRNTPAQEQAYFNQIQQISTESYNQRKVIADKEYDLAIRNATQGRNFTDQEIADVHRLGVAYAALLDKKKGLANKEGAGTDVAAISKAQEAQDAAERFNITVKDRAQNRLDAQQMRAENAANADLQKQQEIKQQIAQINSERIASITKMLEFEQDAFGKEISASDEHYRQLIFKQEQFIAKQKALQSNPKSSAKVKGLAGQAISASKADINQLQKERYSESEKLLIDHNRSMLDIVTKGALDLKNAEIANIEDEQKRELAGIDNSFNEKLLTYKEKNDQYQESINALKKEVASKEKDVNDPKQARSKTINQNELDSLKQALNAQYSLLAQNTDAVTASEKAKQNAIDATNKKYYDQATAIKDSTAVLDAQNKKGLTGGKDNPFNTDLQKAQQQQLMDEYNAEVTQKGLTEEAKLLIEKQYLDKSKQLTQQNQKDKEAVELQGAEIVANAALSIIGNANKSAAQSAEVTLNKNKETELANTSLTSAQKLAINNKYRILEGQAKVKEFRSDQKLSLAKTAIAGAEAIVKALPNPILIALAAATTAAELGIIATEKPPAYASGGVHSKSFASDGKGSVLPGYSRRDNVNAQLRSGEAVIVSEAVKNPYARSILSGINQAFGGRSFGETNLGNGYAVGGIVTDGNNSNRYYAQPQLGTENLANSIAYSMINNFPPIITDVKDVNTQQGILNKTYNRVTI